MNHFPLDDKHSFFVYTKKETDLFATNITCELLFLSKFGDEGDGDGGGGGTFCSSSSSRFVIFTFFDLQIYFFSLVNIERIKTQL
tara:strand:+ start:2513 stop:2767 length:255 start_codon:yes stop_codon:yes gene_type:complete